MCKYCDFKNRENVNDKFIPVQYGCGYASIEPDEPQMGSYAIEVFREDDDVTTATFEINFCPMCGRKLTEEK